EIAKNNGGILSTVSSINSISDNKLLELSMTRIDKVINNGVKVIEIKTGYGLCRESEFKISNCIKRLQSYYNNKILIIHTFMSAHAKPINYKTSSEYISNFVVPYLKETYPLFRYDFVDIFHEESYFSTDDVKMLFEVSKQLNIKTKIHADEFNN